MNTIQPSFHGSDVQGDGATHGSILAPIRSRTGMLWLLGSVVSLAIGAWLLVGSQLFGIPSSAPAARSDQLSGAFVILMTLVSMTPRTRPLRLANVAAGGWLLITSWFVSGGSDVSRANSMIMGLMLIVLSAFLGKRRGL
jgi:hypothetical protein